MLYLSIVVLLLASPIPDWMPGVAAVVFLALAAFFVCFFVWLPTFGAKTARKLMRGEELTPGLMKLRDAGHPVRKHQHMHYSAQLSEKLHPLTETEYEELGIDEDFHH